MKRGYKVGTGTNPITVHVHTGTTAKCFTAVFLSYSGGQKVRIAESENEDNGRIPKTNLGSPNDLVGASLIVKTHVDTSALPEDIIKAVHDNPSVLKTTILVEYAIDGGITGTQLYDYDYDDTLVTVSGKHVWIYKEFDLMD